MTKAAAIYQFWSSFGLTAYEENTVPTDAAFPYITYQLVTDSFDREIPLVASLWYRSESFGGYAYTKATDANGAPIGWQKAFASRLNQWRRLQCHF